MQTVNLNLEVKTFVSERTGDTIEYIDCSAIVDGIKIKFYIKDATAKQVIKNYLKKGV